MSLELLNATLKSGVKPSAMKFVLLALSNYANEDNEAYPSRGRVSDDTGLDLKTVQKYFLELEKQGYIVDTGKRKGRTNSTKVFHVSVGKIISTPKNGAAPLFPVSRPKNGLTKQTQKRVTEPLVKNLKETIDDFSPFWDKYGRIGNRQQALKAWNRLSKSDKVKAVSLLNFFIDGLPDFQKPLRLHASTYLNNKRWEDEPVNDNNNDSQYEGYK